MIKRMLLVVALMLAAHNLGAQSLNSFKQALQLPDTIWGAKVSLSEAPDVTSAFAALSAKASQTEVYGYRIEIFTDNSQNARAAAFKTCEEFTALSPDIPTKVAYDKLYWKVTVGQCATAEEAIALWGKIKQTYPKAFLARETISIKYLNK